MASRPTTARSWPRSTVWLGGRARGSGALSSDVGDHLVKSTKQRFLAEIAPDGTPWAITRRKERKPSARILYRTGRLERSIKRWVNKEAGFVEVRSGLRYAYIQHYGSKDISRGLIRVPRGASAAQKKAIKRRRAIDKNIKAKHGHVPVVLPARPILGVTSDDSRELLDIINGQATKLWR